MVPTLVENSKFFYILVFLPMYTESIMNKFPELQAVVYDHSPLIIAIAESWCTSFTDNAELCLNGYKLFCDNRPSAVGRGVLF